MRIALRRSTTGSLAVILALVMLVVALAPLARAGTATIGSPIVDFGQDTNGNGLYDELVVVVPVVVTYPGGFLLSVSLFDSSATNFITSQASSFNLGGTGTINLGIELDGKAIRQSGFDGPYAAYIELDNTDGNFSLLDAAWYTTNAYLATDFDQTPILFAPPHSDTVIDLNGNGLYDLLQVQVNVNVSVAGTYYLIGTITDMSFGQYVDSVTAEVSLPVGLSQVLLNYSGWGIRAAGVDGPYFVYLYAEDLSYNLLAQDSHVTQGYAAASFEQPPGALAPPYSDHGVDSDGDGLYDSIAVDVPISVTSPATFDVFVSLYGLGGGPNVGSKAKTVTLSTGNQTVEVLVSTLRMVALNVDGPYELHIALYAEDPNTGSQVPIGSDTSTTGNYSVDQFDGIPAHLGPAGPDRAIDRDVPADGLFDVLAVNVTVDAAEPSQLLVDAMLFDASMSYIAYDNIFVPEGLGNHTVTVNFPGVDIRAYATSGPFDVEIRLWAYAGSGYTPLESESYTTASYNVSDFGYAAPAFLDGYLWNATSHAPLPNTQIEAFNYRTLKEAFTVTDAGGHYTFGVEEGTWIVTPEPYDYVEQALVSVNVTAPGTTLDFNLTALVPQTAFVNLTMGDWGHATRDRAWIFSYGAETARQYYDWWFGNRDGYMTSEEYNASLGWPGSVPVPLPAESTSLFRIDAASFGLVPGSNAYVVGQVEGSIFDPRPMTGLETGAYTNLSAPLPGYTHQIDINVSYDLPWNDRIYNIALPAGYVAANVSAPVEFAISGLGTANVTINPPVPADPNDGTAFAWVTIEAQAPDVTAPEISAVSTTPASPELGSPTTIAASVTDAGGVQNVSIQISDPNSVDVGNFTMALADGVYEYAFTPSILGTYSYSVYAVDSSGNGAMFTGTFDVADTTAPTFTAIAATPDPQEIGASVGFSAEVSDLSGVQSATVEVHGPSGALLGNYTMTYSSSTSRWTAAQTFSARGTYAFTVWATDGQGNLGSSSGTFVMRDTTAPTLSGVTATPSPVEIHGTVAFSAAATDLDGIASVKVEIRNPQGAVVGNFTMTADTATSFSYSFAPSLLGTYTYTVTAADPSGNMQVATGSFVVRDTTAPTANAGADQSVAQGAVVTFDGSASSDNDAVATYTWTFNDNGAKTLTGAQPTYTFAHTGTFTVTLTVADASGNTATDTMTVTVTALPPTTGSISGTVVDGNGNPIAGATVDLLSGSTIVATRTTNAQGQYSFTGVAPGSYTIRVQATGFDSKSADVTVVAGQDSPLGFLLTTPAVPPPAGIDWVPILVILAIVAAAGVIALLYLRRRKR